MNNSPKIFFPVVAIAKYGIIHFARKEEDLTICSLKGFKNGFYNDLNIIDSEGNSFEVKEAIKIGHTNFLWGFSIFYGQKIRVRLLFKSNYKQLSLEDFRMKILKNINVNKHFWNSGGDFEQTKKIIRNGNSFKEILLYLNDIFYGIS